MLTKPLAYKGPVDHLSQFFELTSLYQGLHLLLQDLLMDWQHLSDDEAVQGVFLFGDTLAKARLGWPLSSSGKLNGCSCDEYLEQTDPAAGIGCQHMAALAIESKVRLERLPQPLRQTQQFSSEWAYLCDWLTRQSFDPYPNMARHRVAYLLDYDGEDNSHFTVTFHKAYLTQQDTYQRKADLELATLQKAKLPKFVSLTDQQIFHQIDGFLAEFPDRAFAANGIRLKFPECQPLLHAMVLSGRCFWQNCHRQALSWQQLAVDPSTLPALSDQLWLDKSSSALLSDEQLLDDEAMDCLSDLDDDAFSLRPELTISSEQIALPWLQASGAQANLVELDVAKVELNIDGVRFKLSQLLAGLTQLTSQGFPPKPKLLESIASCIHQLEWVPTIASHFEQTIANEFDVSDRFLQGDISHWLVLFRGLQDAGWDIEFAANFKLNQKSVESWYSRVSSESGAEQEWFELELGVIVDGHKVNILPYIVKALRRGDWQWAQETSSDAIPDVDINLDDGQRIRLPGERLRSIIGNLVELGEKQALNNEQRLKLSSRQFSRIAELEQTLSLSTEWQDSHWLKQKALRLQQFDFQQSAKIPDNVHAELRGYQLQGVNWLQFLREESLNGVLADDMGLGKTLQALAHIQIEKNSGRMRTPALVVAPTSLLGNWLAEAARFTPDLNLVSWAGSNRSQRQEKLENADLIITSYGVLLRDAEVLNDLGLYLLILDEAQTIKNARSRIARITYAMNADHRLCLTGTPLENHLGELWSLFHFLMPGFLGEEAQFKRLFRIPIEKENDFSRQRELGQRVAPFMLRRTKQKVATDLPAKTQISEPVELTEVQADLYETIRMSMLDEVQKVLNLGGKKGNQLLIGNALLRLRQVCCHPSLVEMGAGYPESKHSAKLNWLATSLPEMLESGRRVLLFSSFTSMLDLIGQLLESLSIPYLTLTGKTRNRSTLVESFQAGEAPVFLISLKAGGAGLNLTAADTVIHFDPWWNPAAEAQASDRAHRIGQDKPVFVYKLISQGTVEERIHLMQEQKQALADELYEHQQGMSLAREDWQALLAPLEE